MINIIIIIIVLTLRTITIVITTIVQHTRLWSRRCSLPLCLVSHVDIVIQTKTSRRRKLRNIALSLRAAWFVAVCSHLKRSISTHVQPTCYRFAFRHAFASRSPNQACAATLSPATWHTNQRIRLRGFQGYCLTYTVKGPQFEETKSQITLNRRLIEESRNDS